MSDNPYAAPRAAVADAVEQRSDGDFLEEPRSVPAGNGAQWVVTAWALFKEAPLLWFVFMLIVFGISFALGMVPFLGPLVQNLAWPFVFGAVALFADGIHRGRGADLGAAFSAVPAHATSLLLLGLVYVGGTLALLAVSFVPILGIGFFTGATPPVFDSRIGLAFLIYMVLAIPFIMATYFGPTLVVLQNKAPLDAMRLSFRAGVRNILPIIVFILVVAGLGVAATLPLLLGWFVLGPVLFATAYATYRDVFFD